MRMKGTSPSQCVLNFIPAPPGFVCENSSPCLRETGFRLWKSYELSIQSPRQLWRESALHRPSSLSASAADIVGAPSTSPWHPYSRSYPCARQFPSTRKAPASSTCIFLPEATHCLENTFLQRVGQSSNARDGEELRQPGVALNQERAGTSGKRPSFFASWCHTHLLERPQQG